MWPTLKRAAFILWINGTTMFLCKSPQFNLNITFTNAGAFLFSETDKDFILTASNPIRYYRHLNVTVDRVGYGEGCALSSGVDAARTNVTLTLPTSEKLLDASVNVTCKK